MAILLKFLELFRSKDGRLDKPWMAMAFILAAIIFIGVLRH
jgi:hypothetical protein